MNKLMIRQELLAGKPLHELVARYELHVKRHQYHANLVHIKYGLDSPMREPLVQQCRGIIMDSDDQWKIVARPFDKFFNIGDPNAAKVDWRTAKVQEKLDGSLMVLYSYQSKWYVATTGTPDASGEVNGFDFTFKELFWRVFFDKKYRLPEDHSLTYMFELMTPYNQVVVRHPQDRLVLLGVRQTQTGLFEPLRKFESLGYEIVRQLEWKRLDELAKFEGINPMEFEGYVISDTEGKMVKLKHPGYVVAHQLKGSFSPRMVIEAVRSGDYAEIVATFPEWKSEFELVKSLYEKLHNRINGVWLATKQTDKKKDFAIKVKDLPFSGVLFGLYDKHYDSVYDGLRKMHVEKLQALIERIAQ